MRIAINRHNARWYAISFFSLSWLLLSLAGYFSYVAWEKYDSQNWPRVPGSVIRSYSTLTCGSNRSFKSWEARIDYRYVVDGATHEASRVSGYSVLCDNDRNEVIGWLNAHYPVGRQVEVFYNPSDPDAAFLEVRPVRTFDIALILAALVICGLMAYGGRVSLSVGNAGTG